MILAVLWLHRCCVLLSVGGFVARFALRCADSRWMDSGFVRVAPHVVDSVLFGSAVALCLLTGQWPVAQPWLTAKVAGLLCYIVFGSLALSRFRSTWFRSLVFAGAILCIAFIVHAALTRQPW